MRRLLIACTWYIIMTQFAMRFRKSCHFTFHGFIVHVKIIHPGIQVHSPTAIRIVWLVPKRLKNLNAPPEYGMKSYHFLQ